MAPDAGIVYLGARCDDDLGTLSDLDALTQITDHRLASIVSNSWGTAPYSPGLVAADEQSFQQSAAEGIGFCFGSGDSGDNSIRTSSHQPVPPGFPAADPCMQADLQQAAGMPMGFANPAIYARFGTSAYHDVSDHPLGDGPRPTSPSRRVPACRSSHRRP